jgi:Homeodomain-like domain
MAGALLTPEDRAHFLAAMRRQGNSAVHRRMNALLLLDDGWTAERVAEALFIDAETARAHLRLYAAGGRAGIERLAYAGHAPVLGAAQVAALSAELSGRV